MAKTSPDRPRLGRGLSSLISVSDLPVENALPSPAGGAAPAAVAQQSLAGTALEVELDSITPNPHQPRRSMDERALNDLASSIKGTGLIQPVLVRKTEAGYQLIAGERRWRAARIAGLTRISVIIREVDGFTQAQMALVENIQREDLNPIDRALGYRALVDQLGLTQNELAGRLGEDRTTVTNFLRLLDLTPPVQEMVRTGEITIGHAKILVTISDPAEQQRLAKLVVSQNLAVRNLENLLGKSVASTRTRLVESPASALHIQDLQTNIARQIGMKVLIKAGKKGRGRMVIHYSNLDQFDDLLGKLGVKKED